MIAKPVSVDANVFAAPSAGQAAVVADGLSKVYRLYDSSWDRIAERLTRRARHHEHAALLEVSFQVPAGEGLGIVGQNGAGKSTLLKLLAGVLQPTSGRLQVRGSVSSILELGAGFHPEFTGRQNIRLNAAMLGLDARTVETRLPAIVDFCELGDTLDRPVKTYSTGMVMRLAFSIATQVEPDVLIVDEALSVGDGYFQKKCTDRILELLRAGTTLLFCSHAMYYVAEFCRRTLWLRDGRAAALGDSTDVIRSYEAFLAERSRAREHTPGEEPPAAPVRIEDVAIEVVGAAAGLPSPPSPSLRMVVEWTTADPTMRFHLGIGIDRADGVQVLSMSTHWTGRESLTGRNRYRCGFEVPELPVLQGEFHVYVFVLDEHAVHVYGKRVLPNAFRIEPAGYRIGLLDVPYRWIEDAGAGTSADCQELELARGGSDGGWRSGGSIA